MQGLIYLNVKYGANNVYDSRSAVRMKGIFSNSSTARGKLNVDHCVEKTDIQPECKVAGLDRGRHRDIATHHWTS